MSETTTRPDGQPAAVAQPVRSTPKFGVAHRLYTGDLAYDFIGNRKRWYLVSVLILLVCFVALGVRGLNLGIDFRGGSDFRAPITVTSQTVGDVADAVRATGLPDLEGTAVNTLGEGTVRVQTRSLTTEEVVIVRAALAKVAGTAPDTVAYSLIGATWGSQITTQGLIALGVFLALVSIMIWAYFRDWKMSVTAIIALIHDLVVTVGVYALVGFSFTPASLIAVLTILGYSLYDTVVVFDKIRENVHGITRQNRSYSQAANLAVNQVLIRSINTTIIGVLPVGAILLAGAFVLRTGPLQDLGLAMMVGMIAGAYSSIFIATPLLCDLKEREPDQVRHRHALDRRLAHQSKATVVTTAPVGKKGVAPAATEATHAGVPLVDEQQLAGRAAQGKQPGRSQPARSPRSRRKG